MHHWYRNMQSLRKTQPTFEKKVGRRGLPEPTPNGKPDYKNLGRHYGTLRKRENFVCYKALRYSKCFHNATPVFNSLTTKITN